MAILALDTSTSTASVAVLDADGRVIASREATAARHSTNLLRLCDEALSEAGLRLADLDGIAVGAGPGSFTGLRVGFALGKGLCLPTGLPFVTVSSLAALAADMRVGAPGNADLVLPCIDAGKGEIHAQLFDPLGEAISDLLRDSPAALAESLTTRRSGVVLGGPGAIRYADDLGRLFSPATVRSDVRGPTAASVGRLALVRLAAGPPDNLAAAVPSYGRPPDITKPKPRN